MEQIVDTTMNVERMSFDMFVERMKELRDELYSKYDEVDVWAVGAHVTFIYKKNDRKRKEKRKNERKSKRRDEPGDGSCEADRFME